MTLDMMIMEKSILDYYLRRFEDKGRSPGIAGRRQVGMEAKFCLTDRRGEAVEYEQLEGLFRHLEERGWALSRDRSLDIATGAVKAFPSCPAAIATGTGHCKIEFSVPYGGTLQKMKSDFDAMVDDVRSYTGVQGVHLLCLGVHPVTGPHPGLVQRKSRHIFWDRVFKSGLVHLFALSADCQVHVDVEPREVHKAVNVLQGFAGAQIALTANATIWRNRIDPDYLDVREAFWDMWLPGEDRAGVVSVPFRSLADYVDRLASMRPVFVLRDGRSLGIYHYMDFKEYYRSGSAAYGVTAEGEKVPISPEENDIDLHDTFNWYVARFSRYCTVENRANCQQPPEDIMAVPALTLGLVENLDRAERFLAAHQWDALRGSRLSAVRTGPGAVEGGLAVADLCRPMLCLARDGLSSRGRGEEDFLSPLWERLERGTCPALEARRLFEGGGIDALLEHYSL